MYENEFNVLPKRFLLRRVAQTTDFLAEMIETDFNRSLTSIDV